MRPSFGWDFQTAFFTSADFIASPAKGQIAM
jgi:hypothetical protein